MDRKHISLSAEFVSGNVVVQYKLGNWTFMTATSLAGGVALTVRFEVPKFAGGGERVYTDTVAKMPESFNAWTIYSNYKALADNAIAEARVQYYEEKLAGARNKASRPISKPAFCEEHYFGLPTLEEITEDKGLVRVGFPVEDSDLPF